MTTRVVILLRENTRTVWKILVRELLYSELQGARNRRGRRRGQPLEPGRRPDAACSPNSAHLQGRGSAAKYALAHHCHLLHFLVSN